MRDARRLVTEFARRVGVPDGLIEGVRLAVSEAVGNVVLHGYRGNCAGDVTVVTVADDSRLEVVVRDDGCGMSPHPEGGGAGLGLPLIAELADALAVRPGADGRGTEVAMTFRTPDAVDD